MIEGEPRKRVLHRSRGRQRKAASPMPSQRLNEQAPKHDDTFHGSVVTSGFGAMILAESLKKGQIIRTPEDWDFDFGPNGPIPKK